MWNWPPWVESYVDVVHDVVHIEVTYKDFHHRWEVPRGEVGSVDTLRIIHLHYKNLVVKQTQLDAVTKRLTS